MLRQFILRVSNKGLGGHFSENQRKLTRTPFGDVVTFIEKTVLTSADQIPTFRLSDLIKLYNSHLSEIRVTLETKIYITRFRSRPLTQLEKFSAYDDKMEVMLVLNQDIQAVIGTTAERKHDDGGKILAKEVNITSRYVKYYQVRIIDSIN